MRTRIATSADLAAIHNLLAHASRQQMHIGGEDIEPAIERGRFLLLVRSWRDNGIDAAEELLACLVTAVDVDSAQLSASQPVRSYVRGVAFARQISPTTALQQLLHAFAQSAARTQPQQLIAYSSEKWLDRALHDAGMTLVERVDYFALERLQKRSWHAAAFVSCIIRDATHTDLNRLVALDSRTFDALWRYAWRQMWDAWVNGPMLTAWIDGELAGYTALTVDAEVCTIARLAVDPAWQGRGLGRALMTASLQLAQEVGCTRVILNTQATNQRAQKLYRAFGFRQTGESFAVFVLDLPAVAFDK
ncbi:MAG: GNAT family N-acetyltransferase [Caldilinea sp.]